MSAPLDLSPWVARIEAQCPSLRAVGLAGDLDKALEQSRALPGAYVLPAEDRPSGDPAGSIPRQRVRARITVLLGMRAYGDATGGRAADELQALRAELWAALLGWQPPGADLPNAYGGGQRAVMRRGAMWWQDTWITDYWIRP